MKLKKVSTPKKKFKKVTKAVDSYINTSYTGDYRNNFPWQPIMKKKEVITTVSALKNLCNKMMDIPAFAFDTETNTLEVLGENKKFRCADITISWGENNNYDIVLGHLRDEDLDKNIDLDILVKLLKPVFERRDVLIIGHNLKFDMHVMKRLGISIRTPYLFDTMLASWLCNENTPNGLKENSLEKMGLNQTHFKEATESIPNEIKKKFGYKANSKVYDFGLVLVEEGSDYCLADSFYTWCLYLGFVKELEDEKMDKIYYKITIPFLPVLFEMEEQGVTVDVEKLKQMGVDMQKDIDRLQYEIYELAGVEFNIGSSQQKAEILFGWKKPLSAKGEDKSNKHLLDVNFGFRPTAVTKSGNPSTDSDTIWRLSLKEYKNNKRKQQGVEMCNRMLDYAKLSKLKTAFVDGIIEQLYADGKAHPSFNQIGTDSGRLSCIAEDTPIKCVGEDKPIQNVKVGDLVYCYDEEGNVRIRKVLNVIDNGVRPCVSVNWSSQGNHSLGSLVCTPDHKIRLRDGSWVKAEDLSKGDRVTHLRKSDEIRLRLYGLNGFCEKEQIVIKREVFGSADKNVTIHHIDHNPSNNVISNLTLMTKAEHTSYHTNILLESGKLDTHTFHEVPHRVLRGSEHPMYTYVTTKELEIMVREARGRIREIPMDFNTFKKKCKELNFDYKKVAGEYQTQYREVSDEDFIKAFYECKGVPYAISRKLNIGRTKVANTINRLDLCYNHNIVSVTSVGDRHVYDLEIEDFHNFIASEVCVHNCSKPNLQQLPKAEEDDKYQIRSVFIGSLYAINTYSGEVIDCAPNDFEEGEMFIDEVDQEWQIKRKKIIAIDYHNLEMVCLTHFSGDKNLSEMFANDDDAHGSTAVNMFNLDCTPMEAKKMYPHLRQAAKTINFMLMYGGGAGKLYESLKSDHYSPLDLGSPDYLELYKCRNGKDVAQQFIDKYFESYSGVAKFIAGQKKYAHRNKYVYTILGRKRRLPDINSSDGAVSSYCERLAVNASIQGTAGDITISAQNRVSKETRLEEMLCYMMIQVHDELVFECPEEYLDEAIPIIKYDMEHPFGDSEEVQVKYLRADYDTGNSYQEAK